MDTRNLSFDKHLLLQFRSGLREQQRELLHTIENAEKEIRDFSAPVPLDPIDLSGFTASKESLFARASHDRSRLRLIQRALERVNDGSFGICVECEGPIGMKRLQALPWASHCIQCQEQAEVARLAGNLNLDMTLPHGIRDSGT
jgi:DnaK suppressor protein